MTTSDATVADSVRKARSRLVAAWIDHAGAPGPSSGGRARLSSEAALDLLTHLAEAIRRSAPELFTSYTDWYRIFWTARGTPAADLHAGLEHLVGILGDHLPASAAPTAVRYAEMGRKRLAGTSAPEPTLLRHAGSLEESARRYLQLLLAGNRREASQLVLGLLDQGVPIQLLYRGIFEPTQHELGRLWQLNEINIPQEHYCTAVTQSLIAQLEPYLFSAERCGRALVGAAVGDERHQLGIRMVCDWFEMDGWDTWYLGANVPLEGLSSAVERCGADVAALSVSRTPHLPELAAAIGHIRHATPSVRILVGGDPFRRHPTLWRELGADGTAGTPEEAVRMAHHLLEERGTEC